jgi:hypothetical protein
MAHFRIPDHSPANRDYYNIFENSACKNQLAVAKGTRAASAIRLVAATLDTWRPLDEFSIHQQRGDILIRSSLDVPVLSAANQGGCRTYATDPRYNILRRA